MSGHAVSRRHFLVLLRAGDQSLHPSWLEPDGPDRTWDLHISWFGDAPAPPLADRGGFSWSRDGGRTKWSGLAACLAGGAVDPSRYSFIALPDDDMAGRPGVWSQAFALAAEHDLDLCQISLHPRSFYMHQATLQRAGSLLRHVSQIEFQAPILKQSVFAFMAERFDIPNNIYGIEYETCASVTAAGGTIGVLDAVAMLHTKAYGVSAMYADAGGSHEVWRQTLAYLAARGLSHRPFRTHACLDRHGRRRPGCWPWVRPLVAPRLLKSWRRWRGLERLPLTALQVAAGNVNGSIASRPKDALGVS